MNKRLFIGIPVSYNEKIEKLVNELKEAGANLSLVAPDDLHFTLNYTQFCK